MRKIGRARSGEDLHDAGKSRIPKYLSCASCLPVFFIIFLILGNLSLFADPSSTDIKPTVIIDAGHGGTDQGAKAKFPYCEEKKIALQTARLAKKYLEQLGYHVTMTRSTDAFIPLWRRVEIARQSDAAIFVSLHFNSSRTPTASGIEIFFYNSKEKRASLSKRLADSILTRVIRRTSAHSRGVKKGNLYVIRETTMPAVLLEGGFISNPEERAQLKSLDYQEKIARGVADGIDHYFKKALKKH